MPSSLTIRSVGFYQALRSKNILWFFCCVPLYIQQKTMYKMRAGSNGCRFCPLGGSFRGFNTMAKYHKFTGSHVANTITAKELAASAEYATVCALFAKAGTKKAYALALYSMPQGATTPEVVGMLATGNVGSPEAMLNCFGQLNPALARREQGKRKEGGKEAGREAYRFTLTARAKTKLAKLAKEESAAAAAN